MSILRESIAAKYLETLEPILWGFYDWKMVGQPLNLKNVNNYTKTSKRGFYYTILV